MLNRALLNSGRIPWRQHPNATRGGPHLHGARAFLLAGRALAATTQTCYRAEEGRNKQLLFSYTAK